MPISLGRHEKVGLLAFLAVLTAILHRPTQGDKHPCLRPDCGSSFVRKYDLKRHNVSCHDISIRFDCPQERCDRRGDQAFTRKDHCQEHVKTMHPKKKPKAMEPSP